MSVVEPIRATDRPVLDLAAIRADFPVLARQVRGKPLVYLDNAASSQKPEPVIEAMADCYRRYYANIHRGVHALSEESTAAFEAVREKARAFLGARSIREIIFTRGATEAINLVASSYGGANVRAGDEVVISAMEHHSNIVPWQMLCERVGATLRVAPMNEAGELVVEDFAGLLNDRTRMVALSHVSNALGTINPVKQLIAMAHERGVPVLLDSAQAAPHLPVDVQALDVDFLAVSAHKMYGPPVGVLYGKEALLEAMPPYQGGGDMIRLVTFEHTEYAGLPHKFEAGTPAIADVIGFGATLDWVGRIGMANIAAHEDDLRRYCEARLVEVDGVRLVGTAANKAAVVSFTLDGVHPHDMGTILDREGVAVRAGHHCAQPVMDFYGVPATARASFAVYNTRAEVDVLVEAVRKVKELFA